MNRRHSLPAEVYALVEQSPATVLLECSKPITLGTRTESRTRLFADPLRVCVAYTPSQVAALFSEIETAVAAGHTAAGYFAYECGNCFEPKAGLRPLPAGQPLAWFGIYQHGYLFNHATGAFEAGEPPQLARFRTNLPAQSENPHVEASFGLAEDEYADRIAAIHELIRAGDIYQLNFTAPLTLNVRGSIASLYAKLRARQPVEYGAFIHSLESQRILSFSPELFFRIDEDRRITTRPMKGTAPRGRTRQEDRELTEWLRNDAKNRAENLMIVDLLRNDLGRLARFGTVSTENMFAVERYSTLLQMTSTVTADLRTEIGFYDVFRALFPCGSVTGAPKVRAMQLLAQLEEQPRGVYTGAIGFFSPKRTIFNVAIRTLSIDGDKGTMGVGSGIVIDSVAAEEYSECHLKAKFLLPPEDLSLRGGTLNDAFMLIETVLWDGGFPLLELHLDRLADSADYFAYPFDRAQVKAAIEAKAQEFAPTAPRRVRLLLNADGELSISCELLEAANPNAVARLRIAANRANSADTWLYHKTTNRAFYQVTHQQATNKDFDELIFLNQHGEVTEGAISNIFIEKGGRLFTPPVACGLLPGVYRRYLLQTRPNTEERILTLDDLRTADAVYICNAVRGLRKAQIDC